MSQRATLKCKNFKACKRTIRPNETGYCRPCLDAKQRADIVQAHERRLADKETTEDALRRECTDLRASVSALRNVVDRERAKATVEDRIHDDILEFIKGNPFRPRMAAAARKAPTAADHEMVALLSDAHYPEVVDPDAAMGISYGPDLCERRLRYWRDAVIRYRDLRATSYPTRKITVAVNGDMISGDIHEELEVTNAFPTTEAVVKMAYLLFEIGTSFAEVFPEVSMIVMPGNHPRLTKKPRYKDKWNNWEYVLGRFVQALAGKAFAVEVPKAIVHRFPVFDRQVAVAHGDGMKSQSSYGIPWYGLKTRKDAFQALLKTLGLTQIDYLLYGHFHRLVFDDDLGFVINGSVKGGDEYSIGTRYQASPPVQALLTFHGKHGLTDLSRINLEGVQ